MNSRSAPEKSVGSALLALLGWAALSLLLVGFFYQRKLLFFRDYAIIFDGAARLAAGQSPFSDFGMPTGPVSLFIPAIFMRLFGSTWAVLQASQLAINVMILGSMTLLLRQLGQGYRIILVTQACTAVLFLIFLNHPWYNSTALLLLLLSFNLILLPGWLPAALAGATVMLCIFTKQDFGLAALLSNGALLLYQTARTGQPMRASISRMASFVAGLALVFGVFWWLYAPGYLAYWFNHGQQPHTARRPHFKNKTLYFTLIFALAMGAVGFFRRQPVLLVCGLILFAAHLTASLSGAPATHYYGVMVVPVFLVAIYALSGMGFAFLVALAAAILILYPPVRHALPIYADAAAGRYEIRTDLEEDDEPDTKIVELGTCDPAFSNIWGPASVCMLIGDLRARIASAALPARGKILNMTELSQLTAALGYTPPTGHPLWYDPRVSLFPRERALILQQAKSSAFDLVLIQSLHGDAADYYRTLLETLRANPSYTELPSYLSPSARKNCRRGKDNCDIKVFIHRPR